MWVVRIFILSSIIGLSFFFLPPREGRLRLMFYLKGPLNPKIPTNQQLLSRLQQQKRDMCTPFPKSLASAASNFVELLRLALFWGKALAGETPHTAEFLLHKKILLQHLQ